MTIKKHVLAELKKTLKSRKRKSYSMNNFFAEKISVSNHMETLSKSIVYKDMEPSSYLQ